MPQNVGDLLHRRSGTKKSAGHAVPENVGSGPRPSTSSITGHDRLPHSPGLDRFVAGGDMANKYGTVRRGGPLLAQIRCDRGACHRG
jgi:hypothetical protein